MALNTARFRLFIALSVAWSVIVLLSVTGNASSYWGFADYAIPIIGFTAPVWLFWTSVWIWPTKFDDFFNSRTNSENMNEWVYVEESVAKTHKYYGIGGWAILIVLGLALGPFRFLAEFYVEDVDFDEVSHISGFIILYRAEEAANWALALFSFVTLYYLINHKPLFQKMYLILMLSSIVVLVVDAIVVIAVFENSGIRIDVSDIYTEHEIIKQIAATTISLLWVLYAYKSKRINITTRNRLKKKHMHLLNTNEDCA